MEITRAAEPLALKRTARNDNQELKGKIREFEAILIEKMLGSLAAGSSLFGSGMRGDFYQSLFLQELAKKIAERPGLGVGENIYRSLRQQEARPLAPGEDGFRL